MPARQELVNQRLTKALRRESRMDPYHDCESSLLLVHHREVYSLFNQTKSHSFRQVLQASNQVMSHGDRAITTAIKKPLVRLSKVSY